MLEGDLVNLQLAFSEFIVAQRQVLADLEKPDVWPPQVEDLMDPRSPRVRMFHHASTFIVVMRRFARLLEAANSHRSDYPPELAEALRLSWRIHKDFLGQYTEPRNAIEHIDGELGGENNSFLTLKGDILEVVNGKSAPVTCEALKKAENAWQRVLDAIGVLIRAATGT
jgi:hypothetical protein